MTAAELANMIRANGAELTLTASGKLKLTGDQVTVDRWLGTVRQYEQELLGEIKADGHQQEGER